MRALGWVLLAGFVSACGAPRASGNGSAGRGTSGGSALARADAAVASADAAAASAADAGDLAVVSLGDGGTDPARAQQLYIQGAQAFGRSQFREAAQAWAQAYQLNPSRELAYNLGRVYERMGEVEQGIQSFERALTQETDARQRTDIERRIAGLRAYAQRRAEGVAIALPTQEALNQEGVSWFERGVRFFQRRQYQNALMAFEQASNHLQTPELTYNLGMTYERMGNISQALDLLRQYLRSREGSAEEQFLRDHIRELEQRQR